MSRRLNLYGFSMIRLRQLFGSKDRTVVERIQDRLRECPGLSPLPLAHVRPVVEVVERAVMTGVPFSDLEAETDAHSSAVTALAGHEQEWLITEASNFDASALEVGLWGQYRKHASPEARAFLRGLVEGVPMFGSQSSTDGTAYAVVSLDRLRFFLPHLQDLADLIEYRVSRKASATEEDQAGVAFAAELCGWVDEIITAERDLLFVFG